MRVFVILLVLIGFVGIVYATHDPDQPYTHSIILPQGIHEKTFEEFMDWCVPFYGEKCTKFYPGTSTLPPLKQIQSGIPFNEIQCKQNLILIQKYDGSPACVTTETAWNLVDREWATAKSLENKIKIQEIAGAEILEFSFDNKNKSIVLQLDSFSDGHLIITIPRDVLDSQIMGQDDDFFILIDGKEIDFSEIKDISKRTFTIPFENGSTKIEITVPTLI